MTLEKINIKYISMKMLFIQLRQLQKQEKYLNKSDLRPYLYKAHIGSNRLNTD